MTWRTFATAIGAALAIALVAGRDYVALELMGLWVPPLAFGVYGLIATAMQSPAPSGFSESPHAARGVGFVVGRVGGLLVVASILLVGLPLYLGRKRTPAFAAVLGGILCSVPAILLTAGEMPWVLELR
jgi:hypothetical protein